MSRGTPRRLVPKTGPGAGHHICLLDFPLSPPVRWRNRLGSVFLGILGALQADSAGANHRQDASLDRFRQVVPPFDNELDFGVNWSFFSAKCAGFCVVLNRISCFSRVFC